MPLGDVVWSRPGSAYLLAVAREARVERCRPGRSARARSRARHAAAPERVAPDDDPAVGLHRHARRDVAPGRRTPSSACRRPRSSCRACRSCCSARSRTPCRWSPRPRSSRRAGSRRRSHTPARRRSPSRASRPATRSCRASRRSRCSGRRPVEIARRPADAGDHDLVVGLDRDGVGLLDSPAVRRHLAARERAVEGAVAGADAGEREVVLATARVRDPHLHDPEQGIDGDVVGDRRRSRSRPVPRRSR